MYMARDDLERLIDQYIFSELHRAIVKRKLFDDIPYEELAAEFHMSDRQCKRIVYRAKDIIFSIIPKPANLIS